MIILILLSIVQAQLDQLRETELGSTLLETVQLHIQADEPTGDLLLLLNEIHDKLLKQRNITNKLQKSKLDECMHNVESLEELIVKLRENKVVVKIINSLMQKKRYCQVINQFKLQQKISIILNKHYLIQQNYITRQKSMKFYIYILYSIKQYKYQENIINHTIYSHKPHIEQYEHMKSTKNKEKELLIKNIEICQNRENSQKDQYHKLTVQLQEKRYDYVNQKNPLSLKIDQSSLKPLLNDLIDFTTDMMSLEDKYFDEKEQQTRNLIQLYQSQLDSVVTFLNEIQENIEETEHLVKQLELEYNEINHRINLKQEQVNDTTDLNNFYLFIIKQNNNYSLLYQARVQQYILINQTSIITHHQGN